MTRTPRLSSHLFAFALMVLLAPAAFADPPGRVGRLAGLQGQVWLYDVEAADWVAAPLNQPLTSGDRVATDGDGRAEVRVGSTTLRLDAGTELEVLQLDDAAVRVQLHNGVLAVRLRSHEAANEFELVTDEGRFRPERAGRYRVDRLDAASNVTVWSGQLRVDAPDVAFTLTSGQRADLLALNGRTQYTLVQPQRDSFDDVVAAADQADERSVSAQYVSPEMTGAEELDRYGRWETDVDYGPLWVPRVVVPGWAPYRYGRWAWVQPWGWTWIDDARWGFAPFHYGRWVYRRNVWCWAPGRYVVRPVYAPALVAWVGAPPAGGSVAVGVGPRVGWFPLGPREVFVPGYRTSETYVRNVNVTHVTNITNVKTIVTNPNGVVQQTHYANRGVPGAVTVVPAGVVAGRQPVAPARVQLTDPRPSAGGARDIEVAALPTVSAIAPVQAPPPRRPATSPSPAGGTGPVAPSRQAMPVAPAAPGAAPTAPSRAAAPPPMTRPATRPSAVAEPAPAVPPRALPTPAAPAPAAPMRPPSNASPEGRAHPTPAPGGGATGAPPAAAELPRRHRPAPPAAAPAPAAAPDAPAAPARPRPQPATPAAPAAAAAPPAVIPATPTTATTEPAAAPGRSRERAEPPRANGRADK